MSAPIEPDRPRLPWDPPEHFEKRIPEGDNRERLICGRCEFIHYQNPKIVAGAVCTWQDDKGNDRILMAKRAIEPRKGFWTLPAGYMELNESAMDGAAREAWEEARAKIAIDGLLAVYNIPRISQVQLIYRATLVSPDVSAGPESQEVELFRWEDVPWQDLAFPSVRWALNHWREVGDARDFATRSNPDGETGEYQGL